MNRRSNKLVLLLLAALLLAAGYALLRNPDRAQAALELPAAERAARAAQAEALLADEPLRPEPRQDATTVEGQIVASATQGGAGRLVVRAIDALSEAPLDRLRVRVASATRLADKQSQPGSADLELMLTPGRYALLALSRGYEPYELPDVPITSAETVILPPLRMREGSARVAGLVHGDVRGLRAELVGDGRRPCALCLDVPTSAPSTLADRESAWSRAEPCPHCGFAAHATRRGIAQDGRFGFDRLVSGSYALRLVDERGYTIGLPRSFVLREAESLPLELEDAEARTIEIELHDTDGTSLAREWAARIRGGSPPADDGMVEIVVHESSPHTVRFDCSFKADEMLVARAAFSPPLPLDAPPRGYTSIGVGGHSGRRAGFATKRGWDDRARMDSDQLRPETPAPVIQPSVVEARLDGAGLVCFEPLPSSALVLELSSGPFATSVAIPFSRERTHVRAQLRRREGPSATLLEFEAGGRR